MEVVVSVQSREGDRSRHHQCWPTSCCFWDTKRSWLARCLLKRSPSVRPNTDPFKHHPVVWTLSLSSEPISPFGPHIGIIGVPVPNLCPSPVAYFFHYSYYCFDTTTTTTATLVYQQTISSSLCISHLFLSILPNYCCLLGLSVDTFTYLYLRNTRWFKSSSTLLRALSSYSLSRQL